jgi:hypothetical protein
MAGSWIKIEHSMPDKPEVDGIAVHLKLDHDAVVGKLLRFWIWADQQTIDGKSFQVTDSFIDRLANCSGFASALVAVGWLANRNGRLSLPNFDRHNGQTAKSRALSTDRVKRLRNDSSVTKALPEQRRTEKTETREDSVKKTRVPGSSGVSKKRRSGDLDRAVLDSLLLYEAWLDRESKDRRNGLIRCQNDVTLALALRTKALSDSTIHEPIGFVKGTLLLNKTEPSKAWERVNGKHEAAASAEKRSGHSPATELVAAIGKDPNAPPPQTNGIGGVR